MAPAATGPTTLATSEDIEYAANTGPPRPSTMSPTTAAGATSSSPEPNPSTAMAIRKPGQRRPRRQKHEREPRDGAAADQHRGAGRRGPHSHRPGAARER